jgi:DNA-binding MarR family transcriptional regulator
MMVSVTTPSKKEIAAEAWRLISECSRSRWMEAAGGLQQIGLTPGHLKLLMMMQPGESRPMGALAQEFACDASTMTWLVDRLEERGLVERQPMPGDRRVKAVALTSKGTAMRRKASERLFEPPPQLLALDRGSLDALLSAFGKVASHA